MSQITVENIKRSTETASRSTRGVAAAWVNFNGTGTVAVRDSENVASLVDDGTGSYRVNFSNAFGAADYAPTGAGDGTGNTEVCVIDASLVLAGSAGFIFAKPGVATGDPTYCVISIHGDLA